MQAPPSVPPTVRQAPAAGVAPYDFSGLGRLVLDPAFMRQFQELFVETVPQQLVQLRAAVAASNWPETERKAHMLKSTLGTIKSARSVELLQQIEHAARQHNHPDALPALLEALEPGIAAVVVLFRELLAPPA